MKAVRPNSMNLFLILLLIFLLASINYWNGNMTGEEPDSMSAKLLSYSALFLTVYSIILYLPIIAKGNHWIHKICFIWCCLMPFIMVFTHNNHPSEYALTIIWPLLFEVSYRICISNSNRLSTFRKLFIVIFSWGVILLIQSRIIMSQLDHDQTNTIYFSLLALPWLLLPDNRKFRILVLASFSLLVLFSMKRSAMLIMALVWGSYFYFFLKQKRNKVLGIFLVITLLIVGYVVVNRVNEQMGGRIEERMTEETGEDTGRLAIWTVVITMIQQSSISEYLLGHGHFAVKRDMPFELSAHNDILEVIYDYGLLILVLYLLLWFFLIMRCYTLYRTSSPIFIPYLVSVIIFVVMSMVSHLILYTSYFNYLVVFWGCVEGLLQKERMANKLSSKLKIMAQKR